MNFLAIQGSLLVPPPCQVVDGQGHPAPGIATGIARGFVASAGGQLVSNASGTLISDKGAGLITNDGGSLVSNASGTIVSNGAAQPASASDPAVRAMQTSGAVAPRVVTSNGIPGTFTRSFAVDGITGGVTYTITNLKPPRRPPNDDYRPVPHRRVGRRPRRHPRRHRYRLHRRLRHLLRRRPTRHHLRLRHPSSRHRPRPLLNYTGTLAVLVINPDPNGGASLPATVTVTPAETGASLKPTLVSVGQSFNLTVTGSNFVNGATVQFNGTPLTTTFVSATTLTAAVPGNLVRQVGTAQVTVVDPFGVGTSALAFTIAVVNALPPPRPGVPPVPGTNPLPSGRSVSPASGGPPPNPLPAGR